MFGKARRTIGEHIKNIYEEGELDKESTWREFRQVQKEGDREVSRKVSIYNLDIIISVGYRVKSQVGTEFRKWATQRLKDYFLKGYSINQKHELHPNQIALWKKEFLDHAESVFERDKQQAEELNDLKNKQEELYTEMGRLKIESDWLKKSCYEIKAIS